MPEGVVGTYSNCSECLLSGPEGVIVFLPEGVSLLWLPNGVRNIVPEGVYVLGKARESLSSSVELITFWILTQIYSVGWRPSSLPF